MKSKKPRFPVKEGQVWEDIDKRMYGRRILVQSVSGNYAYCVVLERDERRPVYPRIRLDRFRENSTGYRLVGGTK